MKNQGNSFKYPVVIDYQAKTWKTSFYKEKLEPENQNIVQVI